MKYNKFVLALILAFLASGCNTAKKVAIAGQSVITGSGNSSSNGTTDGSGNGSNGGSGGTPTQPYSQLAATPQVLNFGPVTINTSSIPRTLGIKNVGTGKATLDEFKIPVPFVLTSNTCPPILEAGSNCALEIAYSPVADVDSSADVIVKYDGKTEKLATVTGGALTQAYFTVGSPNFGAIYAGGTSGVARVTVTNQGETSGIPAINYYGDANITVLNHGTCDNAVLAKNGTCYFEARANPSHAATGQLTVKLARVNSPGGVYQDSNGYVNSVIAGTVTIYRKRLAYNGDYLYTQNPSEGPAYAYEGPLNNLFVAPFGTDCVKPVFRGIAGGRHLQSNGGEAAIAYESLNGWACNSYHTYSPRWLRRYQNFSTGQFIDTASDQEAALLVYPWVLIGPLGWVQ